MLRHHLIVLTKDNRLKREVQELKLKAGDEGEMVGNSPSITQLKVLIDKIAPTNSRVLITGPAGSGKEVAARLIHAHSRRAGNAFVAINCATMEPDRLEAELFGENTSGLQDANGFWMNQVSPEGQSIINAARSQQQGAWRYKFEKGKDLDVGDVRNGHFCPSVGQLLQHGFKLLCEGCHTGNGPIRSSTECIVVNVIHACPYDGEAWVDQQGFVKS